MRKTLIFDLDGTLLDTLADLCDSTNYALKALGFPERTMEEIRSFVGNGLRTLMRLSLPADSSEETVETLLATMKAYYTMNYHNKTVPYDGIINLLEGLKQDGFFLAIASNKADSLVQLIRTLYFDKLIPVAVGESEQCARKPAPDMVFHALQALDRPIEDAVYIGDSEVDLLTARNAGIPCLSVGWGFRTKDELLTAGASRVILSPQELYTALQQEI